MVRENQIAIDKDRFYFACIPCGGRTFSAAQGLLQHCRQGKIHTREWCERCCWLFVSSDARERHVRDSLNHWLCSICDLDAEDEDILRIHMGEAHRFCHDCQRSFTGYRKHRLKCHNRCQHCEKEFDTENELVMVS